MPATFLLRYEEKRGCAAPAEGEFPSKTAECVWLSRHYSQSRLGKTYTEVSGEAPREDPKFVSFFVLPQS
jgi:hypothetical protein